MVTEEDLIAYDKDGVVCLRAVVGQDVISSVRDAAVQLMDVSRTEYPTSSGAATRHGDTRTVEEEPGRFFSAVYLSETDRRFRSIAFKPELAERAAGLMRSGVARFFYDQLFVKEPGTVSPTLWHHDLPFWPLQGENLISCWIALTPVTLGSSGLEYIAGSHRWPTLFRATAPHLADPAHEPCPDFRRLEERADLRFLSWDMQPGDVLFHHPLVVHGAGGNTSSAQRRMGLSIRYIGDDARWVPRDRAMRLPRNPNVAAGSYPDDDAAFPIAWKARA